jgi:hypothetical protein
MNGQWLLVDSFFELVVFSSFEFEMLAFTFGYFSCIYLRLLGLSPL